MAKSCKKIKSEKVRLKHKKTRFYGCIMMNSKDNLTQSVDAFLVQTVRVLCPTNNI